ncbi:MAG: EAL domain-containing protein [Pseudomonadota bacterium]
MSVETKKEVPTSIYLPLVDSLFKGGPVLALGIIINSCAIFATFINTGQTALLICALAFTGVGLARFFFIWSYRSVKATVKTNADARKWEIGYSLGASASVLLLGIWCYLSFATTSDAFSQIASFTMTMWYVIGIFGRNFGSPQFVIVQILCAALPMISALVFHGSVYHWLMALFLVPMFYTVKMVADKLRVTLLDLIVTSHDMTALVGRFDTALTNMPHGLFMFDPQGDVLVANDKAKQILGLSDDIDVRGWSLRKLFRSCLSAGSISANDGKEIAKRVKTTQLNEAEELVLETVDGLTIEITFQGMESGGVIAVLQDISERRQAEQTINRMAWFDSLTGLPNRRSFESRLAQVFKDEGQTEHCALLFVDLDNFKQVNDTLGHSRGDMLLQVVAERLRSTLRNTDVPARFGGDEFVVLQANVQSKDAAAELAERVVEVLSQPYMIQGIEILVSASVGIAILPGDGKDPEQVLKNADMALYEAKAAGRKTWRFFEPSLEAVAVARRRMERDLRQAIQNDEFVLHYQPIIDIHTGKIRTCEALLRWYHPERGMVPPGEFIVVAEEIGAIAEIGELVMEKACRECASWPGDVRVAVNISPIQFSLSDVADVVGKALEKSGLPPSRLEAEITESVLLQSTEEVSNTLNRLRQMGVSISLDDFGTGYSSLSYLHSFPLDKVKIDRSFLEGLSLDSRSLTLLCGVARLSTSLGLRVTVEGVETTSQLELVTRENFVHEGQGYLFSRPIPAEEVRQLIVAGNSLLPCEVSPKKKRNGAQSKLHNGLAEPYTPDLIVH